jgi:cysteine desulfurase / selenocysteine lyase
MSEITPEMIAEMATKLYRQLPGEASEPSAPSITRHEPQSLSRGSGPLPNFAPSEASTHLPSQSVAPLVIPNDARQGQPPHGQGSYNDGLTHFVRQIRLAGVSTPTQSFAGPQGFGSHGFSGGDASAVASNRPRPFDVNQIRRDFPVLNQQVHGKPLAWLDNAATTQKPNSVIGAISQFYANDNSNIHRAAHTLAARATDAYEKARQTVQKFIGAGSPKEIIFVRGTTEGINLISQSYGRKFLQSGDEILLSTLEHHANIVPWQLIAKERGAIIRTIPVNDRGEVILEEYHRLLNSRTRIVGLTHASNSLGTVLPIYDMTQAAKRFGARVVIDGAQTVAHIPVNVEQLGADYFVFSGHKIFGPTGIGVVYATEEIQEIMPPWQGGGNMIRNVTFEETSFADYPAKFEAGTPSIGDAIGLGAALDYVSSLGLPAIANHEHSLLEHATEGLSRLKSLRLLGSAREKVAVVSFVVPGRSTEEIGKLLDAEGIAVRSGHHCAQPSLRRFGVESSVRPSFSLYNTHEEVDRLINAMRHITATF